MRESPRPPRLLLWSVQNRPIYAVMVVCDFRMPRIRGVVGAWKSWQIQGAQHCIGKNLIWIRKNLIYILGKFYSLICSFWGLEFLAISIAHDDSIVGVFGG